MSETAPLSSPAATPVARAAQLSLALLLLINLFNYIDRYVLAALEPEIARAFFQGPRQHRQHDGQDRVVVDGISVHLHDRRADSRMARGSNVALGIDRGGRCDLESGDGGQRRWAPTFGLLLLMRCFVGIGEAAYGPAAPTIISDLYPVSRRGAVLSWFYMAIPVGSALGYVVGSTIGGTFGWRYAFLAVTPPGIILACLSLCMKDPRRHVARVVTPAEPRAVSLDSATPTAVTSTHRYRALLKNRSFVLDTAGMTAMTFAIGGMSFWMPRYLCGDVSHGCRGLPDSAKALFGGITAGMGLLATLLGGIAGDRLRTRFAGSYFLVSGGRHVCGVPVSDFGADDALSLGRGFHWRGASFFCSSTPAPATPSWPTSPTRPCGRRRSRRIFSSSTRWAMRSPPRCSAAWPGDSAGTRHSQSSSWRC